MTIWIIFRLGCSYVTYDFKECEGVYSQLRIKRFSLVRKFIKNNHQIWHSHQQKDLDSNSTIKSLLSIPI